MAVSFLVHCAYGIALTLLAALTQRPESPARDDVSRANPEIVSPGVLSEGEVFRGEFAPDGVFYFFKKVRPSPEEYRIFTSRVSGGTWTIPAPLDLGGHYSNTYPTISPDGRRLVFASSRPAPGLAGSPNYYLWQSERTDRSWGEPRLLSDVNLAGHYHSWSSFGSDGRLYFRRTTPDWKTNVTLVASFRDDQAEAPTVDAKLEQCRSARPELAIVGGLPGPRAGLYFLDVAIPRSGSTPAQSDIWVCETGGTRIAVRVLGPAINTAEYETFPFFSRDGNDLYFVRGFRAFMRPIPGRGAS
jgi:hypothetical protein